MGGKASEIGNCSALKGFVFKKPHKVCGNALLAVFGKHPHTNLTLNA